MKGQFRSSILRVLLGVQITVLFGAWFLGSSNAAAQAVAEAATTTAGASVSTAGAAKGLGFAAGKAPRAVAKFAHIAASSMPAATSEANRRTLEQKAGRDAAKLLLRTGPTASQVWIDGLFVGNTPMLLIVAPGKYQVEFRGQRQESAMRTVAVLPRETQEVSVELQPKYPTRVTVR